MKTRSRLILERRFRQWANGKLRAVLSAAALLGLALSSSSADALVIDGSLCSYGGSGGPNVDIYINGSFVENRSFDPATNIVNLAGTYTAGDTTLTILGQADGFNPIAFVDKGTGVSVLVVTDLFIMSQFTTGPAKLKMVVDSANALPSFCPGGSHTFVGTADGAGSSTDSAISMTAGVFISDRETDIVVNKIPGDDTTSPSMNFGPLRADGFFSDSVAEDSACGTRGIDEGGFSFSNFDCTFTLTSTIEFTFANSGDIIYSAGSFKTAALEDAVENLPPGVTGTSVVLGSTGVPFARFVAAVLTQRAWDTFEVGALFKLGALSDGIDPVNEPFRLRVGAFTGNLPKNSFVAKTIFGRKIYVFDGIIDDGSATGSRFKAVIAPLFGNQFSLVAAGHGAHLVNATTLIDLVLGSDNGGGRAKVFPK